MEKENNEWKINTPFKKTMFVFSVIGGAYFVLAFIIGFVSAIVSLVGN
jgi:hypothetical protein